MTALAAMLAFAALVTAHAQAFRCGKYNDKLATEGMHKYQILADCGEPASRELVGYENNRIIEEWLYIIDDGLNNQMYLVRFDRNGLAVRIEWLGEVK
jgi:hypothetical protein